MNYTDIDTFLTIASSSSLSNAAKSLFISQPALSHRLSCLEQELGTSLIVRKKGVRNIELTDGGIHFLPIAEKWKELWQETKEMNYTQQLTPFRISNVDSLNVYFMPQVYSRFLENNTLCKLNISTLHSNVAYHAVENHEIDLALITNPHFFKKIQTIPLFKESMKFICIKTAHYKEKLSASDLKVENEIYIPWSNTFLMWHDYWFGATSDAKIYLDNMSLLEHFLKTENAWAIVPSTIAHALSYKNIFKTCNLTDGPDARTCYAIRDNQRQENLLTVAFINMLLEIAATFPDVEIIGQQYRK